MPILSKNTFFKYFALLFLFQLLTEYSSAQTALNELNSDIGSNSYNCKIADVNLDGSPDIYIVNFDKTDKLWVNSANESFISNGQDIGSSIKFNRSVGIADLNGDNYPDLFIPNDANWNSGGVSDGLPNEVWINDSTGKFIDSGQRLGNSASNDVALGDIDNDGDKDLAIVNAIRNSSVPIEIWLNSGNGKYESSGAVLENINGSDIVFCDFDSDGDLDFLATNGIWSSKQPCLWINQGNSQIGEIGTFSRINTSFDNFQSGKIAIADLDNNDIPDVVISNYDAENKIYINNYTAKTSEVKTDNRLKLYPVPASAYLTIEFTENTNSALILRVFDSMGATIDSSPLKNNHTQFDVSNYSHGHYFLSITDKSGAKSFCIKK